MADKEYRAKSSPEHDADWIIAPPNAGARLNLSIAAAAHDIGADFVRQVTAVIREVHVIGGLTIDDDGATEARCKVLGSCNVNTMRCPVLQICGTNS